MKGASIEIPLITEFLLGQEGATGRCAELRELRLVRICNDNLPIPAPRKPFFTGAGSVRLLEIINDWK